MSTEKIAFDPAVITNDKGPDIAHYPALTHGTSTGRQPNGSVNLSIIRKGVCYSFDFDPTEAASLARHLAGYSQAQ